MVGSLKDILHYTFTAESDGERILKIGHHVAKLWARVRCPVLFDLRGISEKFDELMWRLTCTLLSICVIFVCYFQWRSKAVRGPGSTVTWGPPFLSLHFPLPPCPLPLSLLFPSPAPPPAAKRPPNPIRGSGERCKHPQRGLGQSPSRNRLWCILALKSVICWQQF